MAYKLYTTQQVAKELGVSQSLIRTMIIQGTAHPKEMIGHTWVFLPEELERLRTRPKSKGGRPKKQT